MKVHEKDKLAHYAKACTDITFDFPFGNQELMGIAARGDYDLQQHSRASGKALEYHDPTTNNKYIPHVIEPSFGVERLFLALLTSSYKEEMVGNEKRVVLSLHPSIAPIKACVLPLVSNKPELVAKSKDVLRFIKSRYMASYDSSGAIGRRYRRADECGVPFCITVDFDTIVDDTVTVRWRDTMDQKRFKITDLLNQLTLEID
jgi:glycyl-tRNA synthetase